jgi:Na+-translocating ferredoxin:NAD+ oxidoreductase subunit E
MRESDELGGRPAGFGEASERSSSLPPTDLWLAGLWKQNPVFVYVLGMCPVLAVSNSALNALAMGLATSGVLVMSGLVVSSLRHWIPRPVRIVCFILVIASFVTIVDYLLAAVSLELHRALGAFISLIVVNCLILGRAEAFASKQAPLPALADAVGMGAGFTLALLCLGSVRELVGSGSIFGVPIMGPNYQPWVVMILPPGGFFVLAAWLMLFQAWRDRRPPPVDREVAA